MDKLENLKKLSPRYITGEMALAAVTKNPVYRRALESCGLNEAEIAEVDILIRRTEIEAKIEGVSELRKRLCTSPASLNFNLEETQILLKLFLDPRSALEYRIKQARVG